MGATMSSDLARSVRDYGLCVFAVLLCSYFFVYFHRMTVGILGEDIVNDVGGTVGILSSVYFWTYAFMQIPSGILADRMGPRKAAFVFMSIAAVGSFLTAFGQDFTTIAAGKMLIAAGMAVVYIPLMKVVSVWFRKTDFPQLNGIVIAVGNIGAIAASAPLEMLSDGVGGWRNVFIILGLVTFALALLCWAVVRDHPHRKGLPAVEEIYGGEANDATDAKMPVVRGLLAVFSGGRRFWTMAFAYFLVYGSIMVFQGTLAKSYFSHSYDFAYSVAWFITAIGVGKILSTVAVGVLSGRGVLKSKKTAMAVGTACYAAVWAFIWLNTGSVDSYWVWFTVCFLFGFFGGFMTLSFTQVKEWYPVAISGTSVAAMNTFLFLGASALTTVAAAVMGSGYLLDDFRLLWALMFAASVLALVCVLFSKERKAGDPLVR